MVEVFKILKGFYVLSSSTFFTLSSSGLHRHSLKLFKNQYSSNLIFSNRVVEHWNKLTVSLNVSSQNFGVCGANVLWPDVFTLYIYISHLYLMHL